MNLASSILESKRILIVTYYFPPDPSIGSRRWAKLAKYIQRAGHEVKVICVDTKGKGSPWDEDVTNIPVIRIPYRYFRILDTRPQTLLQKLSYRLALFLTGIFSKGTRFDRAIFLKKRYTRTIRKELSANTYNAVFVTGPPHRIMYYTLLLKREFPLVKFISDFRDPWTWWYNLGYPGLSHNKMNFERGMEVMVINKSDYVITPIYSVFEHLKANYPLAINKIVEFHHGFDPEDFVEISSTRQIKSRDVYRIIYFGAVYSQAKKEWIQALYLLFAKDSELKLDIFSSDYENDTFNSYDKFVQIFPPISSNQLFNRLVEYDFVVLVYSKDFKDYFASKFFEMIYSRIPILYFGYAGKTSEFIQAHKLGIFIDMNQELNPETIYKQIISFDREQMKSYSLMENFSFLNQAKMLVRMLD